VTERGGVAVHEICLAGRQLLTFLSGFELPRGHRPEGVPGNGKSRDEELEALRKETKELREERDFLRKATAIFPRLQEGTR
jgi:transposase-like protein